MRRAAPAKEWARKAYVGLDTTILPCFTPDTLELDEAGIRHDMRMLVPQGFFAVTLVSGGEACTTREEDERFVEWCVDEARGRVGVTLNLRYHTLEENVAMVLGKEIPDRDKQKDLVWRAWLNFARGVFDVARGLPHFVRMRPARAHDELVR